MGWDQFSSLLNDKTVLGQEDDFIFRRSMASTGALAAGGWYDLFEGNTGNIPALNTLPTGSNAFKACTGANGAPTLGGSSVNIITAPNPASGKTRHLLFGWAGGDVANTTGTLLFYDLEGAYCDFDLSANTIYNTGDAANTNRLTRYSGSKRVQMGIVMQVTGAGTLPTVTINYGDQGGAAGATAAQTLIAGAVRGRYGINSWAVPLAAGDTGVQSVVSVVTAGGVGASGKIAIFLMRLLAIGVVDTAQKVSTFTWCDKNAFLFPRLRDNFCLSMAWKAQGAPTTPTIDGALWWADGTNPS